MSRVTRTLAALMIASSALLMSGCGCTTTAGVTTCTLM